MNLFQSGQNTFPEFMGNLQYMIYYMRCPGLKNPEDFLRLATQKSGSVLNPLIRCYRIFSKFHKIQDYKEISFSETLFKFSDRLSERLREKFSSFLLRCSSMDSTDYEGGKKTAGSSNALTRRGLRESEPTGLRTLQCYRKF